MEYDEYGNARPDGSGAAIIGMVFGMVLKLLYYGFVYMPIWMAALFLTERSKSLYGDSIAIEIGMLLIVAYLLYCLVYFLKGLMIVFKVNRKKIWIPLFVLCVLLTCLIPTFVSYLFIQNFLEPSQGKVVNNLDYWSALFAIIVGGFIYNKYKFHTDICPQMAFWAYSLGFNSMLRFVSNPVDISPDRGTEFM